jgi:prepilin-type N-terminal cleavage/methylation domain-containing protein
MKLRKITAFSLIELSIVILVIGLLIAGALQGSNMISKAALSSARTLTESSPVASIRSLSLWFESTSKASFIDSEGDR